MLKNNLQWLLVISLSKQININIMDTHHLDFLSPANETPREKNFDDVYLQLDREDALIVEEHIDNIPRVNLNFKKCLDFVKTKISNDLTEGNYTVENNSESSAILHFEGIKLYFFTFTGSLCNSDFGIEGTETQKAVFKSKTFADEKLEIQKQIDLLNAKMNAL
jgi:hypothetical protein